LRRAVGIGDRSVDDFDRAGELVRLDGAAHRGNRFRVGLERDDAAGRPYETRGEQGEVADVGANVDEDVTRLQPVGDGT
jgi:hypothetical protein